MLLKELGGKATLGQIKALAKERYPDATQWHYAISDLQKLEKWGYVARVALDIWEIRDELQY